MGNLAFFRDETGKPVAVLIDFDLATIPQFADNTREERAGTSPFMAREYLLSPKNDYGLHHDLESFYYCAVWHGLGYKMGESYSCKQGVKGDPLASWRTDDYLCMAREKYAFLTFERETLDGISDEDFLHKCKLLWEKF